MKLHHIVLGLLLGSCIQLSAQPLTEIPYRFKLEAADTAFARMDYYNAVEWYEQCYRETREPEIARRIAISHDKMRDYRRAERWYQRIVQRDTGVAYPDFWFEYGRLLKKNAKYEKAQEIFEGLQSSGRGTTYAGRIENELKGIELAQTLKVPNDLLIENAGTRINSRNSESSPALDPDGDLHYVSFDADEIIKVTNKSADYHAKIYKTSKDNRGRYRKGKPISDKVNRPGFHNSHVSFSQDGERMYYTRAIASGGEVTVSDLYYSDKRGGGWGAPQRISSLNGDFLSKHPTTGYMFDTEVLIWSSNRPGTEGGMDLFYATIDRDGNFGQAINMGPAVNSPGDEITPQFQDRMLYFSTDGHPSIGGFDIYQSEWDGSKLLPAEHMGKGINTSVDDLSYTPGDDDEGFLVSNRDGTRSVKSKTCCDDIFHFAKKEIILTLIAAVFEEETPLPGATVKMYQKIGEELGFPDVQKNEEGNEFDFALDVDKAYKVIVERSGYYPDTAEFNTVGVKESKRFRGTFRLEPIPAAPSEPEVEVLTIFEPIRLNNIYYDLDDDQILPDAEGDLDFIYDLMTKYPDMVIELASHTDSRASDAYNEDLSQRRANSAKQYLLVRGIAEQRIKAVGYGEERLINHCADGVQCSEAQHRLNRRTEFTIIEGPQTIEIKRDNGRPSSPSQGNSGSQNDDDGSASLDPGLPKIEFSNPEIDLGTVEQGQKKRTFSSLPISVRLIC